MQTQLTDWIEANIPIGETYSEDGEELDSLEKRGLLEAGVLIEFSDGEQYLIGHINRALGQCDCCNVSRNGIIKRYKIVWIPENK